MMFLEPAELRTLTGRAHKAKQIEQLRRMGIPFHANASGHPIVARAVIEGNRKEPAKAPKTWEPDWSRWEQPTVTTRKPRAK